MSKKKEAAHEEETPTVEGGEGEGEASAKKGKKKLVMIAGGALVLVLIVVGVLMSGVLGGGEKAKEEEAAKAAAAAGAPKAIAKPVYYELPEFLVNLNTTTGRVSFLKMAVTLELRDVETIALMDANKPRILDTFNSYLRELRAQDVQGSAGIYRLRDELLTRINGTIEEGAVKDILFSEIIVQ